MTEREIKLALPGRFALPPITLEGDQLLGERLADLDLRATYFDTPDLRLARHGVTLRFRTGEDPVPDWTLKLPSVPRRLSELNREELHFDGLRREPPPSARSLVTAYTRGEPLAAVATLRTRRRRWRLMRNGAQVAEIADDEVSVLEGRRVVSRFRELEIEALVEDAPLDDIAEQLRQAGAIDAEPIPKVVRALGSRATAPPDTVSKRRPETMGDALGAAIADAVRRMVANDPLVRLGSVEGVHQLRVGLRRLRSDLATLEAFVEPAWFQRIVPELRRMGGVVGEVRDMDVLVEDLRTDPEAANARFEPLFTELSERRVGAQHLMSAALDDPAYAALLDELVRNVERPPASRAADEPIAAALPKVVGRAWDRFERRAAALRAGSDDASFHRARIKAKRARYATELATRLLPPARAAAAEQLASKLAGAQDLLGTVQDAAVAHAVLREWVARHGRNRMVAFEAGSMAERRRAQATQARGAFIGEWSDLRRRRWRRWLAS